MITREFVNDHFEVSSSIRSRFIQQRKKLFLKKKFKKKFPYLKLLEIDRKLMFAEKCFSIDPKNT
ncbi:hypothetical protein ACLVRC_10595, partial [Streptococcus pneumoniae]